MSSGKWRPSCLGLNVLKYGMTSTVYVMLSFIWKMIIAVISFYFTMTIFAPTPGGQERISNPNH